MTSFPSPGAPTSPHPTPYGHDLHGTATHAVDRERELVCDHLAALYAQGVLSRDEFDHRLLLTLSGQSRSEMARGLMGLTPAMAATPSTPVVQPARPAAGQRALHDGFLILLMMLAFLGLMGVSVLTYLTATQGLGMVLWLGVLAGTVLGGGAVQLWSQGRAPRA